MLKRLFTVIFLLPVLIAAGQAGYEKDTAWIRISKMPDDTLKALELFSKALETSAVDIDLSGFFARKTHELSEELKYETGIIYGCDMLGNYYLQSGNYGKSYYWMNKAIRIKEKNGDHRGLAMGYSQLAVLFRQMKNFKMAKVFAQKSIAQSQILANDRFIGLGTGVLSNIFYENEEYDSALYYNLKAYELHIANGDSSAVALNLSNRGVIYLDMKEYDKSIENNLEAYKYIDKEQELRLTLICETNLAQAWLAKNNLTEAEKNFKKIFEISEDFAEADQLMMINKMYADFLSRKGKYKEAYEYQVKYQAMRDSIDDRETKNKVAQLETLYQTEKKDKENALLRQQGEIDKLTIRENEQRTFTMKIILAASGVVLLVLVLFVVNRVRTARKLAMQNEQINKQNATLISLNKQLIESEEQLQQSDEAKAQLLSIISHDISSPVNSLYTFQQGVRQKLQTLSKEELADSFEKMAEHTQQVHLLINNLLDYSFTQQEGFHLHNEIFPLYAMVAECVQLYQRPLAAKEIKIEAREVMNAKISADKNVIRIILRNLISNAVKYSPMGGTIFIRWNENKKMLLVQDEGEGMENEKVQQLKKGINQYSEKGTSGEKGTGLGMKIVRNAIGLMKAEIVVESSPGKGSAVGLIIP
ncbi:MAG: tetratricopeptide repeat-containing sensor histidine kinase [Bacteroidota bacterium]